MRIRSFSGNFWAVWSLLTLLGCETDDRVLTLRGVAGGGAAGVGATSSGAPGGGVAGAKNGGGGSLVGSTGGINSSGGLGVGGSASGKGGSSGGGGGTPPSTGGSGGATSGGVSGSGGSAGAGLATGGVVSPSGGSAGRGSGSGGAPSQGGHGGVRPTGGTANTGGAPKGGQGGRPPSGGASPQGGMPPVTGGTPATGGSVVVLPPSVTARLSYGLKQLKFNWDTAAGATHYRLMQSPTGGPFEPVGGNIMGLESVLSIAVHRLEWDKARYRVDACNSQGCTPGTEVNTQAASAWAIGYLKASTPKQDAKLGSAVALSRDGKTLVVGARGEDEGAGAVYVFTLGTVGTWSEQAHLKASNVKAGANFGISLSLSADGNTLAVGADGEGSAATGIDGNQNHNCEATPAVNCAGNSGAVYVFTRTNTTWQQQVYLKASNAKADASFGSSLALSADGNTLAVGALYESSAATGVGGNQNYDCNATPAVNCIERSGAVYLFTRSNAVWQQQVYLKASNTKAYTWLGANLMLSADGNTLAVGAGGESSAASGVNSNQNYDCEATPSVNCAGNSGAVYVFTRTAMAWSQQAYLKASNTKESAYFGSSLALSGDGNSLAIGAWGEDSAATGVGGNQNYDCNATPAVNCATNSGAVYLFTRANVVWRQQVYLKTSNTKAWASFGTSLVLSGDGNTLAVGAGGESSAANGVGGNQNYDCSNTNPTNCASESGSVYTFTHSAARWAQTAYVKATNTGADDLFGSSVALSGDGNTLAVGAWGEDSNSSSNPNDNSLSGAGAVYLY